MRNASIFFLLIVCLPFALFADVVTSTDDVTTRVIVRQSPSGQSAQVGSLTPGQQAELIGSVPNWYEVRLANGLTGFVPKRWTRVIPIVPPLPPPPTRCQPSPSMAWMSAPASAYSCEVPISRWSTMRDLTTIRRKAPATACSRI